jgi:uncharacterized protein (DUF1501 family)
MIPRRVFLRDGAATVVGLSMVPGFLARTLAAEPGERQKTLVVIFLRGAADGLNTVVPFKEAAYYDYRPTIAIPPPGKLEGALDLDGSFGLNPALRALLPLYKEKRLAIINAVGTPDTGGRSHFQAQDFMESAAPGNKTVSTGWLNRYLQVTPETPHNPLRATAIGETLPKALRGPASAMTIGRTSQIGPSGIDLYQSMYSKDANSLLSGTAREVFETSKQLAALKPEDYRPASGANYGAGADSIGAGLRQVAQMLKADIGVQVAFIDTSNGWDTHQDEAGRLPGLLSGLGQGLAAFNQDMGDRMQDIVVLTMSEFGRTARENGNRGTDHGHANFMFALGGPVKGGRIYGKWPGLAKEQLNEDRDLALTTDFRDVLAEIVIRHLECKNAAAVFPGFTVDAGRFSGIL